MEYYVPMTYASIDNPEVIALHIHAQLHGWKIPQESWLRVHHCEDTGRRANGCASEFIVKGLVWDIKAPYRKATLILDGKYRERLFALLDVDLEYPKVGKEIMLSPLPFENGRPQLPYKGEELDLFLENLWIFLTYKSVWTIESYSRQVKTVSFSAGSESIKNSTRFVGEFVRFGFARVVQGQHVEPTISPDVIVKTFGIEFPK
jgi:hypothetical protein